MATHRVSGHTRVGGTAVSRRVDVVDAAGWSSGLAGAVLASTVSDPVTGAWSVDLDSDDLVYAVGAPVQPHAPLVLGPIRPAPIP